MSIRFDLIPPYFWFYTIEEFIDIRFGTTNEYRIPKFVIWNKMVLKQEVTTASVAIPR